MIDDPELYLAELAQIRDAAQQRAFISNNPPAFDDRLLEQLAKKVRELLPRDAELARTLSDNGPQLAELVNTPLAHGYANQAKAYALYNQRRCLDAQPFFEKATELFASVGADREVGRTLVAQMDNMQYLSRYEQALELEPRARAALEKVDDTAYLCVLEITLGNFYNRLDRFQESLPHYDRALQMTDNPRSIAAIGCNRAQVLTAMNRFDEALQCFEQTKKYCEQYGLPIWADIADHSMARMHFQRGNYSTALRMLEQVRHKHEQANDTHRMGLCDRDRAEIYLQLNLFEDAARLAEHAFQLFDQLGKRYEAAMCLTFEAIAEFKQMRDKDAESAFMRAREMFEKEGNETWVAAVELWQAQLMIRQQRFSEAQALAERAADIYERQMVPVRAANARVLSAQSLQELDNTASALTQAQRALDELQGFHAPWVSYQCHNTLGRLKEVDGAVEEAERLYLRAIAEMESLRGNIRLDELRMSFGKDKYQVYENIVNLKLNRGDFVSAFEFIERSKSRTLIDLLERNLESVWDAGADESPRLQRIRKIREELNLLYSRGSDAAGMSRAASAASLRAEIGQRERELVELLREVGTEKSGWATLQSMKLTTADDVQKMLGSDEALVEYYAVGDLLNAFVITRNGLHVVRDLASTRDVRLSLKGLSFQLSKFHLKVSYLESHADALLKAIQFHLRNLYDQLIRKLEPFIAGHQLLIVPHQILHYVPFQALYNGTSYLIDHHDITYGASASVLKICRDKIVPQRDSDLVLAVADELTPNINDEVEALRELLPNARFFVGAEAREDKLRQYGPLAGKIHIAAHGIFRSDNPMFSSLKLGDSWLNLFDIFNLQLGAELTTLSACETGMSAIWEGDELLGLARGFLYAGTPSLVVSLWTVNDLSTSQLMKRFYRELGQGQNKAHALRNAILEVKAAFPHPYYWAPFLLMGKS